MANYLLLLCLLAIAFSALWLISLHNLLLRRRRRRGPERVNVAGIVFAIAPRIPHRSGAGDVRVFPSALGGRAVSSTKAGRCSRGASRRSDRRRESLPHRFQLCDQVTVTVPDMPRPP